MNGTIPPISQPKNCGLAIWSLVLGILAVVLVCIGPLFSIPAVICGHIAYSRINRSGGALGGSGLALGGLITGYTSIALIPVIALLAAIAIPNFVRARETAQRNMCVKNLRQIDLAKQHWALEGNMEKVLTPTTAELKVYFRDGRFPNCPAGGVYSINNAGEPPTCSIPAHGL